MKFLCLITALLLVNSFSTAISNRSFTVDYKNNCFLKDGKPFRYISGSLHYFRVPSAYWKDRMMKMRAAGLNALQTYVEWSSHEPELGIYDFTGNNDIITFLKMAKEVGLLVIFRPGPYICAEREFGGLPYWLMREKQTISLRSSDATYLKFVDKWYSVLLQLIRPLLYENGGPVITVQVENEYGQFGCDYEYMNHLRDLIKLYLGNNVILFKTDIPSTAAYKCDNVDNILTTADFGSGQNVTEAFETIRLFQESGPLVVTEYYPGWLDHWGDPHCNISTEAICKTLDEILAYNASVNFYMFHGGTNFGFTNGANSPYVPQPTSYDYTAPISESGDPTERYFKIRDVIGKYVPLPPNPPQPSPKLALGPLQMKFMAPLLNFTSQLGFFDLVFSKYPKTFEELSLAYGFCTYSTLVDFDPTDPTSLNAPGLHDRGYIFVDNNFRGILSRQFNSFAMPIQVLKGQKITILVENQGRMNSGNLDFKGLTSNVTLGGKVLQFWVMERIPLNNIDQIHNSENFYVENNRIVLPGFFSVNFTLPNDIEPLDTFLQPIGWSKGVAFLNGFNLGRYWPVLGPQITLYVPGSLLHPYPEENNLILLELESCPCENSVSCDIEFVNTPILNGPTP